MNSFSMMPKVGLFEKIVIGFIATAFILVFIPILLLIINGDFSGKTIEIPVGPQLSTNIDGCEYLIIGENFVHKGNCKNHAH